MTNATAVFLLEVFGEDFLAYVTASTPDIIRQRLTIGTDPLLDEQELVLGTIAELVQKVYSKSRAL